MSINLESRAIQGLNSFVGFILLNILFLLTCIPILTIGTSLSALIEVNLRFADHERGRPLLDYFSAWWKNFRRATPAFLALGIPALLLLFAARFWYSVGGTLSLMGLLVSALGAVYFFAALMHSMALVAAFDAPWRRTVKNALLLPGAEPLRTMGVVLIPVTLLALMIVMPGFLWIMLTIGFSVGAFFCALIWRSMFKRYDASF
ncbi:DUF624 domain-containing protein [Brachybacterium sp. DNPG3]